MRKPSSIPNSTPNMFIGREVKFKLSKDQMDKIYRERCFRFVQSKCTKPSKLMLPAAAGTFAHEEFERVLSGFPLGLQIKLGFFGSVRV